jgi:hypothetical protein
MSNTKHLRPKPGRKPARPVYGARVCDGCQRGEHPGVPHCRGCGAVLVLGRLHPFPWCELMRSGDG